MKNTKPMATKWSTIRKEAAIKEANLETDLAVAKLIAIVATIAVIAIGTLNYIQLGSIFQG